MRYMLDTNMASYVIKGQPPAVRQTLAAKPMDSIVISAVTKAELLYGVARLGHPEALANVVQAFLLRVQVLPWDGNTPVKIFRVVTNRSACRKNKTS